MNRDEIINYIIKLKVIEKASLRYASMLYDYRDDFIQQVYLQILQMPEDKLLELFNKNELIYYILAVCRNNAINQYSDFAKIHLQKNTVSIEDEDIQSILQYRIDE